MKVETKKLLLDARQAAGLIQEFCAGKTLESYQDSMLLRSMEFHHNAAP